MRKIELKRQLFHGIVGSAIAGMIYFGTLEEIGRSYPLNAISLLSSPTSRPLFVVLAIGCVLIILSKNYRIPGITWILNNLEREKNIHSFPGRGAFFFVLSAFIISLFFEKSIVSASMLILSIGDSSSHIIGKELGRNKHPFSKTKNIEGNISGAVLGGIGASIFVFPAYAFVAAFLSMFVEGVDFGGKAGKILDDNLTVPIVSGVAIVVTRTIFS